MVVASPIWDKLVESLKEELVKLGNIEMKLRIIDKLAPKDLATQQEPLRIVLTKEEYDI